MGMKLSTLGHSVPPDMSRQRKRNLARHMSMSGRDAKAVQKQRKRAKTKATANDETLNATEFPQNGKADLTAAGPSVIPKVKPFLCPHVKCVSSRRTYGLGAIFDHL